ADDAARTARYPGTLPDRQPVHTAYVPADRFTAQTPDRWGTAALRALDEHGPLPGPLRAQTDRVVAKLAREPIEDLRVDLEDGYGPHSVADEDADAERTGTALGELCHGPKAPPFCGLRIRSLEAPTRRRGLRTLDRFLAALLAVGPLPDGFRVTVPKVSSVAQVTAANDVLAALEVANHLPAGVLRYEIQVELPQAVLGADGTATVARLLGVAGTRCAGLHFGTYDYSAALGIAAPFQAMDAPAADFAKDVMQAAAAGTGVPVSDGSTNVLPVGSRNDVHAAWELHARLVRRSLTRGLYQGWDLHPAQLVTRYAATFAFFRESLPPVAARLRGYLDRQESGIADEPATAVALAGYLLRGLACGAIDPEELQSAHGLERQQLEPLRARIV
ncbi:MAG: hypothetical protein QOC80_2087, partial [Frankiaceae bacterium]|nr:hypothetical protein [Frankiaceae bacterium]